MKLQIKDCVDIYRFYEKNLPQVPYANNNPFEKLRYSRAVGLGLLAKGGALHPFKGKRLLADFKKKLEQYKTGVPWHEYLLKHEKQCLVTAKIVKKFPRIPWKIIRFPNKVEYITNTEIIVAGKIIVKVREGIFMKRGAVNILDSYVKDICEEWDDTWIEVLPHTFYWDILQNKELIWLTDRTQEIWIPVQATYIKFVLKRFLQKVFFYVRDENSFVFVKAPPTKKIPMYESMAACIQPLESVGDFQIPDVITAAWEEKFRDERKLV